MTAPIIICGHSHRNALGVGRDNLTSEVTLRPLTPPDARFEGLIGRPDEQYWSDLVKIAQGRTIAIFWDGNQYNGHYLLQPEPVFDFYLASQPDLTPDPDLLLVPEMALEEKFSSSVGALGQHLINIKNAGAEQVAVVSAPPPKENEIKLRPLLRLEKYFFDHALALGLDLSTIPISRPLIRLKLWKLEQYLYQSKALDLGCKYISVPDNSLTQTGFLKEELWASDATHANFQYGQIMKNFIFDLL